MGNEMHTAGQISGSQMDRRSLFRVGGLTVTLAALAAACSENKPTSLGRVGDAPTTTKAPDAKVDDPTLLRTASSISYSLINLYATLTDGGDLVGGDVATILKRFSEDHATAAAAFEKATTAADGVAWNCSNPRLDSTVIEPVLARITKGAAASRDSKEIPPSDDPKRDVLHLVQALESMSSAMYQQMVETLSDPKLRQLSIVNGVLAARRGALIATISNPERPGGYIAAAAAAPEAAPAEATTTTAQDIAAPSTAAGDAEGATPATPIPTVSAIPARFGQLGAQTIIVGAGDENGVRMKMMIETPSLNAYVYDYMEPTCK